MLYHKAAYERAGEITGSWSLKQRVGQLFVLAFPGKDPEKMRDLIEGYNIGGCYLSQDNAETFQEAQSLSQALQAYTQVHAPRVPLFLGVDQEGSWGVLVPESITGPGNLALGAADDTELTSSIYRIYGQEMGSVGFNTIFAPCADVNSDPRSPIIGTRSFGQYPEKVSGHVAAAIRGARQSGVVTTAKHFPGHGGTSGDSHREIPVVDKPLAELLTSDLRPFQAAIEAGVDMIMTSHIRYPQIDPHNPATLSEKILKDILRDSLGFGGLIISDSMNMGAMRKYYAPEDAGVRAISAGVDMLMLSEEHYEHSEQYLEKQLKTIHKLLEGIEQNNPTEDLINEKVRRIVAFKLQRLLSLSGRAPRLSREEKAKIEQQAAEQALTVIRDQSNQWPLRQGKRIVCLNASPRSAYQKMVNPRGIGPNQATPAFDLFRRELQREHRGVTFLAHEELAQGRIKQELGSAESILLVTEDYPLPGEDFPKQDQGALVRKISRKYPDKVIVLGLRSPYELLDYPQVRAYVGAFSSRACSARAAAKAAFGGIGCAGTLPVAVE